MKLRSYGGNFIDPSVEELVHGTAGHKKVSNAREGLSYPEYPDSVEGYVKDQREAHSSVRDRQSKKANRFS